MTDIKDLTLLAAEELDDGYEAADCMGLLLEFAPLLIAAYLKEQEPHSYMVDGEWMKKLPPPPYVNGGTKVVELFTAPPLPAIPDGCVVVPKSALAWLFGEEGEFECPPDKYFRGKAPAYWWRSKFRELIAAG